MWVRVKRKAIKSDGDISTGGISPVRLGLPGYPSASRWGANIQGDRARGRSIHCNFCARGNSTEPRVNTKGRAVAIAHVR